MTGYRLWDTHILAIFTFIFLWNHDYVSANDCFVNNDKNKKEVYRVTIIEFSLYLGHGPFIIYSTSNKFILTLPVEIDCSVCVFFIIMVIHLKPGTRIVGAGGEKIKEKKYESGKCDDFCKTF